GGEVEASADAVQDGGEVLAHKSAIRAGAVHVDFFGGGEEALIAVGDDFHHAPGELALEQLYHGADLAGTFGFDRVPARAGQLGDLDFDLVGFAAGDDGVDFSGLDPEVDDGAVADVAPAAFEAIGDVAVGFEVIAPAGTPEGLGDLSALD